MAKIIAFTNHKGGVAKTTTAVSLGGALNELGKRVLLVDLDSQSNLTNCLTGAKVDRDISRAFKDYNLPIMKIREGLFLVPSSISLAKTEIELEETTALKALFRPIKEDYDYILVDCPPNLGVLTINALTASDGAIVPTMAEPLAESGLERICKAIENNSSELLGIVITRYERSSLSQVMESKIRNTYGEKVFTTRIRKNVTIGEAPLFHKDILSYDGKCNGAKDYRSLAQELVEREK